MTDVPSPQSDAAIVTCTLSGQSLLSTRSTRLLAAAEVLTLDGPGLGSRGHKPDVDRRPRGEDPGEVSRRATG